MCNLLDNGGLRSLTIILKGAKGSLVRFSRFDVLFTK